MIVKQEQNRGINHNAVVLIVVQVLIPTLLAISLIVEGTVV